MHTPNHRKLLPAATIWRRGSSQANFYFQGLRKDYVMKHHRGYIFTNKRHSQKAIMSTVLGVISTASMVVVIYLSFLLQGQTPISYGLTGLLALLMSVVGEVLGVMTVFERDRFKLFPIIGIVLNLVAIFIVGFVFYMGMYA
jgi:CHASE2 domain-containing sensor protein